MSQPSPESRISNLEKESMSLGARIEELATDTDGNFTEVKRLLKDKTDFEEMNEVLKAVATRDDISKLEIRFDKVETRLDRIESDVSSIKTTQEQILNLLQKK